MCAIPDRVRCAARVALRNVALRNHLHCTFMPRPSADLPGSGMHTHQSLHDLEGELEQRLREATAEPEWSTRPLTIVTAIGARLNEQHQLVAHTLEALEQIRVWALSQGPAHCSLSVVVDPKDAPAALSQIHELILKTD